MPMLFTSETRTGLLSIAYDADVNVLRVVGRGCWTVPQLERHLRHVEFLSDRARREHGCIRVLADIRGAAAQSDEVERRMVALAGTFYAHGDRVALVVGSPEGKIELERLERRAVKEVFTSTEIAERWLLAVDVLRRQPGLALEWVEAVDAGG